MTHGRGNTLEGAFQHQKKRPDDVIRTISGWGKDYQFITGSLYQKPVAWLL